VVRSVPWNDGMDEEDYGKVSLGPSSVMGRVRKDRIESVQLS
jgi:hypothetical protein